MGYKEVDLHYRAFQRNRHIMWQQRRSIRRWQMFSILWILISIFWMLQWYFK
ncbi:MAG: hypothetical protein LC687_00340 [Actinobacteria bacterium]|nr:hypothetical protein [Actinomycetota bacterium]